MEQMSNENQIYNAALKRGKSNEEATQELIDKNMDIMGDLEEEPLFWYALADTQWNYGRLLPHVKEKALLFLERDEELERWREAGEKKLNAWLQTLNKLKEKLNSPVPKEKRVSKYRIYQCIWKLGDVFAYQFTGEYSKEKNCYGKYVVFRKVSEDSCWPGHIIPVIQVYKQMYEEVPQLEMLESKELLILGYMPIRLVYVPDEKPEYSVSLITKSIKDIPKDNLTFLGNIPVADLTSIQEQSDWKPYIGIGWDGKGYNKSFEKYVIDQYLAWSSIE